MHCVTDLLCVSAQRLQSCRYCLCQGAAEVMGLLWVLVRGQSLLSERCWSSLLSCGKETAVPPPPSTCSSPHSLSLLCWRPATLRYVYHCCCHWYRSINDATTTSSTFLHLYVYRIFPSITSLHTVCAWSSVDPVSIVDEYFKQQVCKCHFTNLKQSKTLKTVLDLLCII